jgi:hypothetical protein
MGLVAASSGALAALSLAIIRPAPSYDPWSWLLWGREIAGGSLSTLDGPSFKPLPVAVTTVLAPLGRWAPVLWVLVARAAAVLAVLLAFRLGRRLAGGWAPAGLLAAAAVVGCGSYVGYAASGLSEGLFLALALAGAEAWHTNRPRAALACGVACGLLRVEAWPFLTAAAVVTWRRRPADRPLLVAAALAVPAAWLLPDLVGSGELFRSAARARVPNPGQPALADVPLLASLGEAVRLPWWPLWAGVALLVRRATARGDAGSRSDAARAARVALVPAAAGLGWIALVAAMAQAGFSGEPRYALPGGALVAVSGAVGLAVAARDAAARDALGRVVAALVAAALLVAAAGPVRAVGEVRATQAHQWALQADLADAVILAGGRSQVLGCGRPYVGRLRGPLLAYRLRVEKHVVEPDLPPRPPGVVFRSALAPGARPAPDVPPAFEPVGRAGTWEVLRRC